MLTETKLKEWMLEDGSGILYDHNDPGIFTGYVTFTPERAEMALENNKKNRKINQGQIRALSSAIGNGFWDPNVAKINFDENMILSDGQHRLLAAIKTGYTLRCLVSGGLKQSAQGVTDRRGKRSLSDDLEIAGVGSSKPVAALTRVHACLSKGMEPVQIILMGHVAIDGYADAVLVQHYKENEAEIQKMKSAVNHAEGNVRGLKIDKKILNVLAPLFEAVNVEDARSFWTLLGNGVYPTEDDPIRLLRILLVKNAEDPKRALTRLVVAALIIKAWNYYEAGMPCKILRHRVGGAHPEKFPEIYNPYKED